MGGTIVPTKMLQSRLPILWRLRGNLEIVEFPNQFYLFKLGHDQDMALACLGSPWTVARRQLILTSWVPYFDPTKVYIATLPIWVSMPGLPLEYWVEDQIRKMVAPVGQFVKIDEVTRAQGRHATKAKAARALVEIDPSCGCVAEEISGGIGGVAVGGMCRSELERDEINFFSRH
ncbi:hypothetical protein MRB53_028511 [Persea americana]|uniref:Uncharacterized protein n=1 Tax=Persea americana TaxID=3435 RepID=A0ACC2KG68_PERAE|nr:hypothetical protein MRB53_028511 [Persea americana]